jgi:hypothetical protein
MNICKQCGSASRDKSGICAGCGAPWPLAMPAGTFASNNSSQHSPYSKLPEQISSMGLYDPDLSQVGTKNVGLAVLLSVLLGPIGLFYCTVPGAIVMLFVSIALSLFLGTAGLLLTMPICAIWAWRAARENRSPFD